MLSNCKLLLCFVKLQYNFPSDSQLRTNTPVFWMNDPIYWMNDRIFSLNTR